jgi:hypothetical protein
MRKWIRTGTATALDAPRDPAATLVGWRWEIVRAGETPRQVRVEVQVRAGSRVTDLPETAKHAIRSRGATAVDAVLDQDDPPALILVSMRGVGPAPG